MAVARVVFFSIEVETGLLGAHHEHVAPGLADDPANRDLGPAVPERHELCDLLLAVMGAPARDELPLPDAAARPGAACERRRWQTDQQSRRFLSPVHPLGDVRLWTGRPPDASPLSG